MSSWSRLYGSICESSLWAEDLPVRVLFVSMLAKANRDGLVEASMSGLARMANISPADVERAIAVLSSPDPESKNPAHEGRRVDRVDGGFRILNFAEYRDRKAPHDRRDYHREYQRNRRKKRDRVNNVNNVNVESPAVNPSEVEVDQDPPLTPLRGKADAPKPWVTPRPYRQRPDHLRLDTVASAGGQTFLEVAIAAGLSERDARAEWAAWADYEYPAERGKTNWAAAWRTRLRNRGTWDRDPESRGNDRQRSRSSKPMPRVVTGRESGVA